MSAILRKILLRSAAPLLFFACLLLIAGCSHGNIQHITAGHEDNHDESSQHKVNHNESNQHEENHDESSHDEASNHNGTTPYTASYQISLPSKSAETVKIDLAQHHSEHHSDKILIKTTEDTGIKNTGSDPLQLRIKTSGFPGEVTFHTPESFDPEKGIFITPLKPGETFVMDFETTISEKPADSALVYTGYIHMINNQTGKEVGALKVIIMDTKINNGQVKPEEECCIVE